MKLNPDCVRDILLAVEDTTDLNKPFRYSKAGPRHPRISPYTHDELLYHFRQCNEAHLFSRYVGDDMGRLIVISDLSPDGHKFLANIRNNSIWSKLKAAFKSIGANSLPVLIQAVADIVGKNL